MKVVRFNDTVGMMLKLAGFFIPLDVMVHKIKPGDLCALRDEEKDRTVFALFRGRTDDGLLDFGFLQTKLYHNIQVVDPELQGVVEKIFSNPEILKTLK